MTIMRMIVPVASAARVRRCRRDLVRRRDSGANRIARTAAQNTAPKNGEMINANAAETAMIRNRKTLSSKVGKLALPVKVGFKGEFIPDQQKPAKIARSEEH